MKSIRRILSISFLALACLPSAMGQDLLKEEKPPSIMKYLTNAAPEYATLVKSINTAKLVDIIEGPGPMTMFAAKNKAFTLIPAGSIDPLLQPEMIDSLQKILTYHVVAGLWSLADLTQKIKEGGGTFSLPTIGSGGRLTFLLENGVIVVKDQHGVTTPLPTPQIVQNGMIYPIEKVLLP